MMNSLIWLAQAGGGGPVQEIARTFGVDWSHLIAQMISFGIVCAILYKFAYRRVLTILEQRSQQIAEGQANAEKIKTELTRTEAQRQEVLTQANQQAAKLIEEARAAAAVQDHARMLDELKREVGHLVVQTTAAVTGKILNSEDHRRLEEETAKAVAA
jgi:F-type H+-transporting ATPase subunit b